MKCSQIDFIIDKTHPSPNYNERKDGVFYLVLHYTAANLKSSLNQLTNPSAQVSAHYLVPETPIEGENKIFQLVDESKRAWHAGVSTWQKRSGLNDSSIGIEIVNLGYKEENRRRQYYPFTDYQIDCVIALSKQIVERYQLHPTCIVAHGDIAPGRKVDPGPLFPWKKLYEAGIGAWYDEHTLDLKAHQTPDISLLQKNLRTYGYPIELTGKLDMQTKNVICAFQMHFRPSNYSGEPDAETLAILENLLHKYFPEMKNSSVTNTATAPT